VSESNTTCPLCMRPPGAFHDDECPRSRERVYNLRSPTLKWFLTMIPPYRRDRLRAIAMRRRRGRRLRRRLRRLEKVDGRAQ
jgi:hypothetical protein